MRERMEAMQREMQEFFQYMQTEMLARAAASVDADRGAIVPLRRPIAAPAPTEKKR
jgi:hypothetical protein